MGVTTKGLRYPDATDRVADGALAIEHLAEDVDTHLGRPLVLTQQAIADILLKLVQIAGATGAVIDARDSANNVVFSVNKDGIVTGKGLSVGAVSTTNAALFIQSVAGLVAYLVEFRDESNVSILRFGGHGGLTTMPSQAGITAFVANNLLATTVDVAKFQVNAVDCLAVDKAGHLCGRGTAPTLTAGTALGTAPPAATITGNDQGGLIKFGTGTAPAAGPSTAFTVTFNRPYATTPAAVVLTPATSAAVPVGLYVPYTAIAAGSFNVNVPSAALAASQAATTYAFFYSVIGA